MRSIKDRLRNPERESEREIRARERELKDRAQREVKPPDEGGNEVMSHKNNLLLIDGPISELDLSKCEQYTPSYRLLSKSYLKPKSSMRSALETSVLNDDLVQWVQFESKHREKNPYEESLDLCEDDRYEMDVLLETTASTATRVSEYMQKQDEYARGKGEARPLLEEFLPAVNLRCIERLYGDHGLQILEELKKNTARAMPVIHSRLVQKLEECSKFRQDIINNKVWSEVCVKTAYTAVQDHHLSFGNPPPPDSLPITPPDKTRIIMESTLTSGKCSSDQYHTENIDIMELKRLEIKPLEPTLEAETLVTNKPVTFTSNSACEENHQHNLTQVSHRPVQDFLLP